MNAYLTVLLAVSLTIGIGSAYADDIDSIQSKIDALQQRIDTAEASPDENAQKKITRYQAVIDNWQSKITEMKNYQYIIELLEINNQILKLELEFIKTDNEIYKQLVSLDSKYDKLFEQNDQDFGQNLPLVDQCWSDDKYVQITTFEKDGITVDTIEYASSDPICERALNDEDKYYDRLITLETDYDNEFQILDDKIDANIDSYDKKLKNLADKYDTVLSKIVR